jgi:hypothetical protein
LARAIRLDKLRALARLYCDQRTGGSAAFVPDTDSGLNSIASVNDLINLALTELYDLLISARGAEYYAATSALSLVSGTSIYTLPSSFYQMQSVVMEWGTRNRESIEDLDRMDSRVDFDNYGATWSQGSAKAYRIRGGNIELFPTPSTTGGLVYLYYVPAFQDLLVDSDTFDGVNGWEKLVALRTAMEMRTIEEQPYSDIAGLYQLEKERIEAMKTEREAARPKRIGQVYPEGCARWPHARRPMP